MGILANSEDPDEMPHYAAFHLGLHCLLRLKRSSGKEIQSFFEIITCDPSIYTMNHPKFIASYQVEKIHLYTKGLFTRQKEWFLMR